MVDTDAAATDMAADMVVDMAVDTAANTEDTGISVKINLDVTKNPE